MGARVIARKIHAPRCLPRATAKSPTGAVRSISTVPLRASSAKRRMEIAGAMGTIIHAAAVKK